MEDKKPDWSISELYEKSFKIVKENKLLWIFGTALAGFSSNFNTGGNWDTETDTFQKIFPQIPQEKTSQAINSVLGEATTSPFFEVLNYTFSQVSIPLLITLIISAMLSIIIFLIISTIYHAWLKSSFIISSDLASKNQKISIEESSLKAFPTIKSMVWLNVVPMIVFSFLIALGVSTIVAGFVFGNTVVKIIFGLLTLIFIGAIFYNLLLFSLTEIWASREIALNKNLGFNSFKRGWKLAKSKFWPSLLLGIVNFILTGIIVSLPIIIIVGLITGGVATLDSSYLGISLTLLGSILLLIFSLGFFLLAGILNAFKTTVWTLAYNAIKNKYEN